MHTVDLSPLYAAIDQGAVLLLAGVVGYLGILGRNLINKHLEFLGQATDKTLADGFDRALQNGANIAMQELNQYEGEHSQIAVQGWLQAKAAQWAVDHSPDYMARFGLSPEDIARKALAKLPPLQVTTDTTDSTVKMADVTVATLPPAK